MEGRDRIARAPGDDRPVHLRAQHPEACDLDAFAALAAGALGSQPFEEGEGARRAGRAFTARVGGIEVRVTLARGRLDPERPFAIRLRPDRGLSVATRRQTRDLILRALAAGGFELSPPPSDGEAGD